MNNTDNTINDLIISENLTKDNKSMPFLYDPGRIYIFNGTILRFIVVIGIISVHG
jgi:hypothetical protein